MGFGSTPVRDQTVYAQDTAPSDERDGVMWVDTSVSPRKTYVYSADSLSWENIAPSNWSVQNTAPNSPSDGDGWIDTSVNPSEAKVYESSTAVWERIGATSTQPGSSAGGYTTVGGTLSDGDTTTTVVTNNSYTNVQISGLVCNGVRIHVVDDTGIPDATVHFVDGTSTDLGNFGVGWNEKTHANLEVDYYRVGDSDGSSSYPVEFSEVQPHETPVAPHTHQI